MARLPWMQLYPADWSRDTRFLRSATKGIWIDTICILWDAKKRGILTLDLDAWALALGIAVTEVETAFAELKKMDIANFSTDVTGAVTVMSRRIVKDEKSRESTRLRVSVFRKRNCNADSNSPVTVEKTEDRIQKTEYRRQKKSKREMLEMPTEWLVSEKMMEFGLEKGMTSATIRHEFEHCKRHHIESRFTSLGWDSKVWQTWVLNWVKFGMKQVPASQLIVHARCAYSNQPCEEPPVPGKQYCEKHLNLYAKFRLRLSTSIVDDEKPETLEDVNGVVSSLAQIKAMP